ncbi:MAG: tyrosine-protein phosphatase [Clostridia bacterium]|nr:tyrosine-protein phosphatase [Clostridia bacterium]
MVYQSLLTATTNTRDLGGHPIANGKMTLPNRIWRSDAPIIWNETDANKLKALGITAIIDLRTSGETTRKPCAYANADGFAYHPFPILAGSVPPATLEEVPETYLQIAKQAETVDALRTIAESTTGILFCCTAGKDRTGVLSAILLLACGADRKTIIEDYVLSREYNKARIERYLAEHPEVNRRIVLANEISMERFLEMFDQEFGSVEGYFMKVGLAEEHVSAVRDKLLR